VKGSGGRFTGAFAGVSSVAILFNRPEEASHKITSPSRLQLTSDCPPDANASPVGVVSWPIKVFLSAPVATSYRSIACFVSTVANSLLSGENAVCALVLPCTRQNKTTRTPTKQPLQPRMSPLLRPLDDCPDDMVTPHNFSLSSVFEGIASHCPSTGRLYRAPHRVQRQ